MKRGRKAILVNAAIVAGLIIINYLTTRHNSGQYFGRFFASGLLILLLAPINLVIGMVRNRDRKGDGPVYIAISGLLLLIGFSVCTI